MKRLSFLFIMLLNWLMVNAQPAVTTVSDIYRRADIVFTGTVAAKTSYLNEKGMICTAVTFTGIGWVKGEENGANDYTLYYLGGSFGGRSLLVSNMPMPDEGQRYLVFAYKNERKYFNPFVGGNACLFRVISNETGSKEYIAHISGKAVTGMDNGKLLLSEGKLNKVSKGAAHYSLPVVSSRYCSAPLLVSDKDEVEPVAEKNIRHLLQLPLTRDAFIDGLTKMQNPQQHQPLQPGYLYSEKNGKSVAEKIVTPDPCSSILAGSYDGDSSPVFQPRNGILGACGYHSVPYVMQQVSPGSWDYGMNAYLTGVWNKFMNVFQLAPNNGSFAWLNGENEFAGWLDSTLLFNNYGFYWTPDWPAVTFMDALDTGMFCTEIYETDIMFNAYLVWASNWEIAFNNPSAVYYQNILNHEMAYAWGMQYGIYNDTYNYDQLSVMHAFSNNITEDGYGIHAEDAFWFRRNYDDQIPVNPVLDVGVEAYWANPLNGNMVNLEPAYSDQTVYQAGDSITLFNVTVENNSDTTVYDMRLRFYLSRDRHISTLDYQLGGPDRYWFWNWFDAESWQTNAYNFTTYIPSYVPQGKYYLGAIITVNGFNYDDFCRNNEVSFTDTVFVLSTAGTGLMELSERLTVMPNPAGEMMRLVCNLAIGDGSHAEIFDLGGNLLASFPVAEQETALDVSMLPPGMYFIRLICDTGAAVVKFIKR